MGNETAWAKMACADICLSLGPSRHLPVLRRSLDFPHQGCVIQAGQPNDRHCGESQDRQLQQQASWRGINRSAMDTDTGVLLILSTGRIGVLLAALSLFWG